MKSKEEIKEEIGAIKDKIKEIESDYVFERIYYETYISMKSAYNGIIDALEWVLDDEI